MSLRHRLRRLEEALYAQRRALLSREVYWWSPEDPESTRFVAEQMFETPHTDRKYRIRIVGEPGDGVIDNLGKKFLPDKEQLQKMSDDEIQTCIEAFSQACQEALDDSRRKLGLPPFSQCIERTSSLRVSKGPCP